MKLLKNVWNKICLRYIRMRSQKGIGGLLRKKQGMRHQTEKNKEKTTGEKVKKKSQEDWKESSVK